MPRHQGQPCSGQAAKRSRASARLRFIDQTGEYSTGAIGEYSSGGDTAQSSLPLHDNVRGPDYYH